MISPTAEYALRATVALAQAEEGTMVTSKIAEITKVPAGYLAKVLQTLGKNGIVRSKRGLGGGRNVSTRRLLGRWRGQRVPETVERHMMPSRRRR